MIADSGDLELDAILGELRALESQFDVELASKSSVNNSCNSSSSAVTSTTSTTITTTSTQSINTIQSHTIGKITI